MTDICSIWAYDEIKASGKLGRLHSMYLSLFSEQGDPMTMHQALKKFQDKFKRMPYKTHHGMGSRISELTQMGFLEKYDVVRCEYTHKKVNRWRYTGRRDSYHKQIQRQECSHCQGRGFLMKEVYIKDAPEDLFQ